MVRGILWALCPVFASAVLRNAAPLSIGASIKKVEQLVGDIEESLTKSSKDASLAYQSLLSTDHQLNSALDAEIAALQKKLQRLNVAKAKHEAQQAPSQHVQMGSEELSMSMKYALGTLENDESFLRKFKALVQSKQARVHSISQLRKQQMTTLTKLARALQESSKREDHSQQPYAFLQTDSVAAGPSLKASLEEALHHKGDTHQILVQIKEMLGAASPVPVEDIQGILREMGATLQMVETEKSHADDASKRCQAEEKQRRQGREDLSGNIALMKTAGAHANSAVQLARATLQNISAKMEIVEQSPKEYEKASAQPLKTLERQAHDRQTIRTAVEKAEAVVSHVAPGNAALGLFRQLTEEMDGEEEAEQDLRKHALATQSLLQAYADEYLRQLQDEKLHYQRSASGLQLYLDELKRDTAVQADTLEAGKDLDDQSEQLCDSIMNVIAKRAERRAQLDTQLRDVYPRLLDYFGTGRSAEIADVDGA
mmetsp:Transcript_46392/g.110502  ORF Transcript_46392/g.110502 Transcript_46392/m.110502 type:complete len:485 (-) Transcript_46392:34-1488(-)|eukprot:CAMPEP_0178404810 /NCGR_PEP_ID=MMETSP0689_2-20121128/18080_1 /TAXON_ID=160604 /ORGANISM="Amphidinium massartii, Strain CS-259" /LENGTH=484 /DNA_ID=CAMNT_0020025815 /DNA_START=58 /DNA_END=1512 /DNA_ORIENTATION=+